MGRQETPVRHPDKQHRAFRGRGCHRGVLAGGEALHHAGRGGGQLIAAREQFAASIGSLRGRRKVVLERLGMDLQSDGTITAPSGERLATSPYTPSWSYAPSAVNEATRPA
jgi:hypothetical protein